MFTNLKEMKLALLCTLGVVSLLVLLAPSMALAKSQYSESAVVTANGTLVRGPSVQAVSHLGAGRYEVTFRHAVNMCAYTASIGDPEHGLVYDPGLVFTAGGHENAVYGVYIETKNMSGGLADFPFHLNVTC